MNARRIYAYVESSQRLCEKLGMRQKGLFKEFISFKHNAICNIKKGME